MVDPKQRTQWKVGELARNTGVSVRALHHYDELGLLRPSGRTPAGHRYYVPKDVERLQHIVSLRQLGLSLEQIRAWLASPRHSPLALLERQLEALDERNAELQRLRTRLAALADRLRAGAEVSTAEFLSTIREMTMFEKHFSKEQLDQLAERGRTVGEARMREVEQEWPQLIAAVRAEMQRGTEPQAPAMQELARRWQGLVREFTGGDPGLAAGVALVYQHEPGVRQRTGLDAELMEYVGKALGRP